MSSPVFALLCAGSLLANILLAALLRRSLRAQARLRHGSLQWSIGIFEGSSPLDLHETNSEAIPALTSRDVRDAKADFVADPFMLRRDSTWYMYFEVKETRTGRGSIAFATSPDCFSWSYGRVVLREPFHLSYPYVFEFGGETYMVPESYMSGSVRLYRARRFPEEWVHEATLLSGEPYIDPSIFRHRDLWWMFTSLPSHDVLRLHFANDLLGPWREHPKSPLIRGNPRAARPAGRILTLEDGRILRFAQECEPTYGRQVFAFEITRLDESGYSESPVGDRPILSGSLFGWNSYKMHHLDAHCLAPGRWIACVDGKGFPFERRKRRASAAATISSK